MAFEATGRAQHLLEKDIWVVWAMDVLFSSPVGGGLVFKGGTSLSKAYGLIDRFSEDVDLTLDLRKLLGGDSLPNGLSVTDSAIETLPATFSQAKRWTAAVRRELPIYVKDHVGPRVAQAVKETQLDASVRLEGDRLFLDYDPLFTGTGYVRPSVQLEFGARSTGEPAKDISIVCDASHSVSGVRFPTARPRTMSPMRTFWEKATAIHVYCLKEDFRGGPRFARHWTDVARLADRGVAAKALEDRELARLVAKHKSLFFVELAADGTRVDYGAAVAGGLRLVPEGSALDALARDYDAMVQDNLLVPDGTSFDDIMNTCRALQDTANAANENVTADA